MAFTMITVTRSYKTAAGRPAAGTVKFTPSNPMVNGPTVISAPVVGTLDRAGLLSLPVAANNDPATDPVGSYYTVVESLTGQSTRTYNVVVPYTAAAGTVDLSTLTTITPPAGGGFSSDINAAVAAHSVDTTNVHGIADTATLLTSTAAPELIRDTIGTALVAGSNVTITPNDAGDTITIAAATSGASGIPASTVDVKGDLIAATANDTVARLGVGTDGLALVANSGNTTGLGWAAPAPAAHTHAATDLASGTVATARLGSGTANSTTFLRGDQTYADPTLQLPPVHAVGNSGTALTIDASSTSGWVKTITLTGNCTVTLTGAVSGRASTLELVLTQDATGSRTVTWPASVKWSGGAPTLSTAAAAVDRVVLTTYNAGTTWYADLVGKGYA